MVYFIHRPLLLQLLPRDRELFQELCLFAGSRITTLVGGVFVSNCYLISHRGGIISRRTKSATVYQHHFDNGAAVATNNLVVHGFCHLLLWNWNKPQQLRRGRTKGESGFGDEIAKWYSIGIRLDMRCFSKLLATKWILIIQITEIKERNILTLSKCNVIFKIAYLLEKRIKTNIKFLPSLNQFELNKCFSVQFVELSRGAIWEFNSLERISRHWNGMHFSTLLMFFQFFFFFCSMSLM